MKPGKKDAAADPRYSDFHVVTVDASTATTPATTTPATDETGTQVAPSDEKPNPSSGSSVTVGSSLTVTPLGILLSLLGVLGIFGLVAAILDHRGVDLQQYADRYIGALRP